MNKIDEVNAVYMSSFVCDNDCLSISVHYSSKNVFNETVYHQCSVFNRSIQTDHESFILNCQQLQNL